MYFIFVYLHLLYGLVACSFTFTIYLHKLASVQNKAVKLIGGGHFLESATQFYAKLQILQFLDLYKFETVKLVHDYMNSKLPLSFSDYFNKSCGVSWPSITYRIWLFSVCYELFNEPRKVFS